MGGRSGPRKLGTTERNLRSVASTNVVLTMAGLAYNLLLIPVVLHVDGETTYGVWVALSTLVAIGTLADGGVRVEVARRVAIANGSGDSAAIASAFRAGLTAVVWVAVPVCAVLLVFAGGVVELVLPQRIDHLTASDLDAALRVLLVGLAVQLVGGVFASCLRGLQRQDLEFLAQLAALVVSAIVTGAGISDGWGLWALVWGQTAAVITGGVIQVLAVRSLRIGIRVRLDVPGRRHMQYLTLSGLALVSQVSEVFDSQWDRLVVARVVGPEAVASFHVGVSLPSYAKVLAIIPLAPLLVAVAESSLRGPARTRDSRAVQDRLMRVTAVLASAVFATTFVFGPAFIGLWLGPGYDDAGRVLRVFVVAVAINVAIAPIAMQALGERLHRICALGAITNIVVNAVLSFILTLHVGVLGAAWGSVAGNTCGALVLWILARSRLSYRVPLPVRAAALAVAASVVAVVSGVDDTATAATLGLGILGSGLGLLALGGRLERCRVTDLWGGAVT